MELNFDWVNFPIFGKIFMKFQFGESSNVKASQFLQEILSLKEIIKHADESSLCIIEDVGQFTAPEFGMVLLDSIMRGLQKSSIFLATSHDSQTLKCCSSIHTNKAIILISG